MNYCNLINVPYIGSNNFPIYQSSTCSCSWFSAETADHRYQVWHINQDPILDRHSLVVVTGLKSSFFDTPLVSPDKKTLLRTKGCHHSERPEIWYTTPYHTIFSPHKISSRDSNFLFSSVNYTWSLSIKFWYRCRLDTVADNIIIYNIWPCCNQLMVYILSKSE